jgi:lysozyme
MIRENLKAMLEVDEGREPHSYPDPLTSGDPWTIGVGHTGPEVHPGLVWTDEQIDAALASDMQIAEDGCRKAFYWFDRLCGARQDVLIDMAFQMGIGRLCGFVRMLGAVRDERWAEAAEQMRLSTWARQTPKRALRLAYQMESGEPQIVGQPI